jgi:uncharacterized Zn ribbon protein
MDKWYTCPICSDYLEYSDNGLFICPVCGSAFSEEEIVAGLDYLQEIYESV